MDAWTLSGIFTVVAGIALVWWRRRRDTRLETTRHTMRCPMHGTRAEVTIATDPAARAGTQHLGVTGCSLLSSEAIGLPARVTYLPDSPPCRVCLEPAQPGAVHTTEISCLQPCVEVLNATAVSATPPPLRCSSGFSDAYGLAEQALGPSRMTRVLWYASM